MSTVREARIYAAREAIDHVLQSVPHWDLPDLLAYDLAEAVVSVLFPSHPADNCRC